MSDSEAKELAYLIYQKLESHSVGHECICSVPGKLIFNLTEQDIFSTIGGFLIGMTVNAKI